QTVESRLFADNEVRMLMTAAAQLSPIVSDVRAEQRRAMQGEIVRRAKSELVETLARGVSHELNNKLTPLVGFAELLMAEADRLRSARLHEYSAMIRTSALEAAQIIRQLLQLSTPMVEQPVSSDIRDIVQQALTLVKLRMQEAGIELSLDLPRDPVIVR